MENNNNIKVSTKEAQAVLDQIKDIIVEKLCCDEEKVVLDACWRDDLCADSLDMAEIMMEIDKRLQIYVNEDDGWSPYGTLKDSCSGVARTLKSMGRM